MNTGFRKRTYRNPGDLVADLWFVLRNGPRIAWVLRKRTVPPPFRERLMLAVIGVYRCRMCSWAHTREAFKTGVSTDEIRSLLSGSVDDCPPDEVVGVLYAQHWADSDAHPAPDATQVLVESYGTEKACAIDLVLRMIRAGNLTGNTWDYLLYRLSFGRLEPGGGSSRGHQGG